MNPPIEHPVKTLDTMRLLAAAADQSEDICVNLTHRLFADYWVHSKGKKHVLSYEQPTDLWSFL